MILDEAIINRNKSKINMQCLMLLSVAENDKDISGENKYHFHEFAELIYVLEGEMTGDVLQEETKLCAGDLYVVYPNEAHIFSNYSNCRYIVVDFHPDILYSYNGNAGEFEYMMNFNSDNGKRTRVIKNRKDIGILMSKAFKDYEEKKYTSELLLRSDILEICAHILEYWREQGQLTSIDSVVKRENIEAIRKVMDTVKEGHDLIKTHDAAQLCNMSDGHFSRLYKSVTGITFGRYVKLSRLAYAQQLLCYTDLSITEISQELNYATTSHFIEDFRKEKGVSPKQYRKFLQR